MPDASAMGSRPRRGTSSKASPMLLMCPAATIEDLTELAELMGHSNLSQVRKYALSDAERARAGVTKL